MVLWTSQLKIQSLYFKIYMLMIIFQICIHRRRHRHQHPKFLCARERENEGKKTLDKH